jgi:hypothetical protein
VGTWLPFVSVTSCVQCKAAHSMHYMKGPSDASPSQDISSVPFIRIVRFHSQVSTLRASVWR